jgi:hypothetical protein
VVSGGTAGNAATDNDDFGMGGEGHGGVLLGWRIGKWRCLLRYMGIGNRAGLLVNSRS